MTLLKTITMQNVAWPITIVQYERLMVQNWKNEFSAMPVMIPGSAIGSRSSSETASRPKKRKRWIAAAAAVPSTSAIAVAAAPTLSDSQSELRASGACQASWNQWSVKPEIGQVWSVGSLNAETMIRGSGSQTEAIP